MRAVQNTAYKFGSLFGEFEYLKTMHLMQNPLFASNHPSFHLNKSSFGDRRSGWNEWYSPPDPSVGYQGGASLGNSWRIAGTFPLTL